jgi:hypothetical protein
MPIPRWDAHDWHLEALADRHSRGKSMAIASAKPSGNGGRGRSRGRRR